MHINQISPDQRILLALSVIDQLGRIHAAGSGHAFPALEKLLEEKATGLLNSVQTSTEEAEQ